ncbi:hypothetical protein BDZ89DRAFT_1133843 [Hymenopellis radicata]|nr:hypothetical protein BDZ89DRAFT_1133843 [Hymenopellis radicata]
MSWNDSHLLNRAAYIGNAQYANDDLNLVKSDALATRRPCQCGVLGDSLLLPHLHPLLPHCCPVVEYGWSL